MLLSKSLGGRFPQNEIEPTENTAPPFGVSKNTSSERIRSRDGTRALGGDLLRKQGLFLGFGPKTFRLGI